MSERVYHDGDIGSVLLDRSNFRLRSANNGEEALRILAVWQADLLVTGDQLEDLAINDFLRLAAACVPHMRILILRESLGVDLDDGLGNACLLIPLIDKPSRTAFQISSS